MITEMPTSNTIPIAMLMSADFFIAPTHMDCDRLVEGKTILSIERLGVPIGVVKDRRGFVQRNLAHSPRNR